MKTVFLDFDTVDHDDINTDSLKATGVDLTLHGMTTDEQTRGRIADAGIVITNKQRLGQKQLEHAKSLKLICLVATGTNNIDLDAAAERGIAVCNIVAYCTPSVVQHVYAMILSLTHHLRDYEALLRGVNAEAVAAETLEKHLHHTAGVFFQLAADDKVIGITD